MIVRAGGDGDGLQGQPLEWDKPEPWPDPVDGAEVLDAIKELFDRYTVMPEGGAVAASVFSLFTWVFPAFAVCPNLMISAPERGSGKTTVMGLLSWMVPRPYPVSDASAAAIYRSIASDRPTLLFDEAQHFLKRRPEDPVRGILLASFTRRFAFVHRCEGQDNVVRCFDVYAPKVMNGRNLVGIDDMLTSRSVVIAMSRALKRLPEFREDRDPVGDTLRRKLARWRDDHMDSLRNADPDVGDDLIHRSAQVWRPMFAVADAAGGSWPALIRNAAQALTKAAEKVSTGDSLGVELLADCKQVFKDADNPDWMPSEKLDTELNAMVERPWATLTNGKHMTSQKRGRLLKPYGIRTRKHQGVNAYDKASFETQWKIYLPETQDSEPENRKIGGNAGGSNASEPEGSESGFRFEDAAKPAQNRDSSGFPVSEPPIPKGKPPSGPNSATPDDFDDPDEREAIMKESDDDLPDFEP